MESIRIGNGGGSCNGWIKGEGKELEGTDILLRCLTGNGGGSSRPCLGDLYKYQVINSY